MRRRWSKARASWRWSIACRPAPALPATTTAWGRPSRPICCVWKPPAIRCSKSISARPAVMVVPLTLELTAAARQLIISGPNTGGKTVTLKTTALLAMMAQAGLPVPATAASFPGFYGFSGRHRRRAIDRSRALHIFRAHHQPRPPLAAGRRHVAGAARRTRLGHRSRRRLRAGRRHRQPLSDCRRMVAHLHASHLAQGLRGQYARRAQRRGGRG